MEKKKLSYESPSMIRHDGLVDAAHTKHATEPQGPGGPAGFASSKQPKNQK